MPFSLATMARQQGVRRKDVTLRPINPPAALATDLAAIYAPAWKLWQDGINRIMAGYDPVPLKDGLIADTADQIQSAITAIANEFITRLVSTITPSMRQFAVRAERVHRTRWINAVKAGTGVDLDMMLSAQPVQETLSLWLNRNVALCKNVSEQAQGRIADAVFRGYQNRTPAREVAKEIREATGMARDRSIRIAADQNAKMSAALDLERQAEAGLEQYRWRHSGKLHPRQRHKERDGKLFDLGQPEGDTPGQAPFCGCRAQAYLPLMEEFGL